MRIACVFDGVLPNTDTDGEQLLNTVAGLLRSKVDVDLILPRRLLRRPATAPDLQRYYQLPTEPRVVRLRSLFPGPRFLEKPGHAVRAVLHRRLRAYDVVHTRNASAMLALSAFGYPVLYETYRAWPEKYRFAAPLFRAAMRRRNFVGTIVHSDYAKQRFAALGIDPDTIQVVYNGFDPARMEPVLSREQARRALELPVERPVVCYTGRVNMAKGLGIVLEMAERTPDADFVIVGSEGRGEVEKRAEQLANARIVPWKKFDELAPYLYAADVLLIPPSTGPLLSVGNTVLPMKLFLYLAAGRPILAPASPDTAEILTHGDNAWLVEPDDGEAAAAALATLLADRELARRLGEGARSTAAGLTWEARGARIAQLALERSTHM